MHTIVAKYQSNIDELTKAYRWHFRQSARPFFRGALWILAFLFCVAGIFIFVSGNLRDGAIVGIFGFLLLVSQTAAAPWLARRHFRQILDRNAEIEWRFLTENIQIIGPRISVQAEWGALSKVVETSDGLLFYFVPQVFYWIPQSSFATKAEFNSIAELAKTNCQQFVKCESSLFKRSIFRGIRFRVQNLLWTTFWVCVWAASLSHLITFTNKHRPIQGLPWWVVSLNVWFPLFLVVWSPTVAIGALFNRTRLGALVGLILVAVVVALVLSVII